MKKVILSYLMIVVIVLGNLHITPVDAESSNLVFEDNGVIISIEKQNEWDGGYTAEVTILNSTDKVIENWKLEAEMEGSINSVWNASVADSEEGFIFENAGWNKNIEPQEKVTFGICVDNASFEGVSYLGLFNQKRLQYKEYEVSYQIENQWDKGAIISVEIRNDGGESIHDWILSFESKISIDNIWNASILSHTGDTYEVGYMSYNTEIPSGGKVTFGMQISFAEGSGIELPVHSMVTGMSENDGLEESPEFLVLDGLLEENELELFWTSSHPGDNNSVFLSTGGEFIEIISNIEEDFYTLNLDEYTGNLVFYIMENDRKKQQSNTLKILYDNGKYKIEKIDTDGDGVEDIYEQLMGSGTNDADSDDDGISDGQEYENSLNPLKNDADMDMDGDGLSNQEEIYYGTGVNTPDSDGDGIDDAREIVLKTDPLCLDTDSDEVCDSIELEMGLDPLQEDSNGDGVSDGDSVYKITRQIVDDVTVKTTIDLKIKGSQITSFSMESISQEDGFLGNTVPGYIGEACDLELAGKFQSALLTMEYPAEMASEGFEPTIYYFNEETQQLEEVEGQWAEENKVHAELEHFSKYILINKTAYEEFWKIKLPVFEGASKNMDIVFAIDSSGSMKKNDADKLRISLSKSFINKLGEKDRVAIVDFDALAKCMCPLTTDKKRAKNSLNSIDSYGNTNIVGALKKSLKVIQDDYKKKNKKMVILLTDGQSREDGYQSICQSLKEKDASVYAIGLGNDVNSVFLNNVCGITGGQYYHAKDAQELSDFFDDIRKEYEASKDTDGDGICDYYEDNFYLGTGAKIRLDKNKVDTDGDTLNDGDEVVFINRNEDGSFRNFVVTSYPDRADTDGDELWDNEDATKLRKWIPQSDIAHIVDAAGFRYSEKDDKIYSKKNCWQDQMGYCSAYDVAAEGLGMYIDCEAIYFNYAGQEWLIELWKGQYDAEIGAEIGVYHRTPSKSPTSTKLFHVSKSVQPIMTLNLYKNHKGGKQKEILSKGRSNHWWQTGFIWGEYTKSIGSSLPAEVTIEFKDSRMLNAFVSGEDDGDKKEYEGKYKKHYKGLKKHYTEVTGSDKEKAGTFFVNEPKKSVTFWVGKPKSEQPCSKAVACKWNEDMNKKLANTYLKIREDYGQAKNDPNMLPSQGYVERHFSKSKAEKYKKFMKFLSSRERYQK